MSLEARARMSSDLPPILPERDEAVAARYFGSDNARLRQEKQAYRLATTKMQTALESAMLTQQQTLAERYQEQRALEQGRRDLTRLEQDRSSARDDAQAARSEARYWKAAAEE